MVISGMPVIACFVCFLSVMLNSFCFLLDSVTLFLFMFFLDTYRLRCMFVMIVIIHFIGEKIERAGFVLDHPVMNVELLEEVLEGFVEQEFLPNGYQCYERITFTRRMSLGEIYVFICLFLLIH
jgi:hypothetical protein